jgi:hypothetical protein
MLKVENTDVFGWEAAIRGMRNPMNSWEKSDSGLTVMNPGDVEFGYEPNYEYLVGENDLKLMKTLSKAGSDHGKFLRMINVTVDITAMQPWWSEFDTYKVGTVRNSCSKMHKIHVKEFTLDDFEHRGIDEVGGSVQWALAIVLEQCEWLRKMFNETHEKKYWRALIELLPEGYRMRATVQLNYQVLKSMYFARKDHKLDEWHTLCDWMLTLPYFKEVCVDE